MAITEEKIEKSINSKTNSWYIPPIKILLRGADYQVN
jgi:hypothetical protein